jgi:stringent starvation protein B
MVMNALESPSTRPYLIRAMYEWCTDHSFTPYVAVKVDGSVQVPREFVQGGEIVLNISFDATSSLQLGNEFIEFKARFEGKPCDIMVPIHRVMAIYARENGQGMSFPVTDSPMGATVLGMDKLHKVPDTASSSSSSDADKPVQPPPSRPTLTRIK